MQTMTEPFTSRLLIAAPHAVAMKLKDILKNAWIFSMAKLPQNLFFLVNTNIFYFFF